MGHIDTIYAQGDDALGSQFEVSVSELGTLFNLPDPLKFRTTSLTIPGYTIGKYAIDFKSQKFTKPNGKIDTPNEFSLSFRVDKYWAVYQALLAWKRYIADEESGAIAEDVGAISGISSFRTDIIVKAIDTNDVVTYAGWKFNLAWPSQIGDVSFDQSATEPIIVPVTFDFVKMTPTVI